MIEKSNNLRTPTIVLPFMPSDGSDIYRDIFIYLRPETNGVKVESLMFGVIHSDPIYRDGTSLAYLGNIPGDFIAHHKIIERHYAVKCRIVAKGRSSFTPLMIKKFEDYFHVNWSEINVVSSYDALDILNISSTELFNLWVEESDFLLIYGQTIKKVGNLYILNYDIPELLHINSSKTDIAVMVLRTKLSKKELTTLVTKMENSLKDGGAIPVDTPPRRCFHYTRSPLEEVLDGLGYLFSAQAEPLPMESISFVSYLLKRGVSLDRIMELVNFPVVTVLEKAIEKEVYLYDYLMGNSYKEAYNKISTIKISRRG